MSGRQPVVIGIALGLFVGILASVVVVRVAVFGEDAADTMAASSAKAESAIAGDPYPGDAELESGIVQSEADRVSYVRSIAAAAVWNGAALGSPYRLRTGSTYTLVLPDRVEPYTVSDLKALAPNTFVEDDDGAYLLSENIVVLGGATLDLAAPADSNGIDIRLASNADYFVSIVTAGGSLVAEGTPEAPVSMTSWDAEAGAPDTETSDGRAYVRVIGGRADLSYLDLADLGFWSGNTGGLALTGTDEQSAYDAMLGETPVDGANLAGAQVLPTGPVAAPTGTVPDNYVSGGLDNLSISGNAFGLFVTNADGVLVRDSSITGSLVDGVVFHRGVVNSSVTRTESDDNAVDGFSVARSSTKVTFTAVTASGNGRDGIALDGQPLAAGPSATGTAIDDYGDSRVSRSTFSENGRYGIAVSGGTDVAIRSNVLEANHGGIVVDQEAQGIEITGNRLTDQVRQSIAIRDSVEGAEVADNAITGGDTALYVRNAGATLEDNTVRDVSNHGVTLVGDASDVAVTSNTISGHGSVPIFDEDSEGATVQHNDTVDWRPALTMATVVNAIFQPLTIVWILLGLVVLATAVFARTRRRAEAIRHPYADRVPITAFTKGFVSRESMK